MLKLELTQQINKDTAIEIHLEHPENDLDSQSKAKRVDKLDKDNIELIPKISEKCDDTERGYLRLVSAMGCKCR